MSVRNSLVATGDGLIDRLLCVTGAVMLSQAPEFIQQYLQRLGGHVEEARRQVEQYRQAAAQSNLTLDQLIAQTHGNSNTAVARLGDVMSAAIARLDSLQQAQALITAAPAWKRPVVFLEHMNLQIVHGTWNIFRPAVPVTAEGLVYALAGMLLFLALYHALIRYPVCTGYRRWKHRSAPARAPAAV